MIVYTLITDINGIKEIGMAQEIWMDDRWVKRKSPSKRRKKIGLIKLLNAPCPEVLEELADLLVEEIFSLKQDK